MADKDETETRRPLGASRENDRESRARSFAARMDEGGKEKENGKDANLDTILRIPVDLQVVLGSATMPVSNLMKLGRGQVVALDQRVGEPVNIVVNGRVIARGEVVVVDEDTSRFGVSLTEIVGPTGAAAGA